MAITFKPNLFPCYHFSKAKRDLSLPQQKNNIPYIQENADTIRKKKQRQKKRKTKKKLNTLETTITSFHSNNKLFFTDASRRSGSASIVFVLGRARYCQRRRSRGGWNAQMKVRAR